MWRKWSKRKLFYIAVGIGLGGIVIMALGGAIGSGLLTTLGSAIAFFLSPVAWLLWLVRVLIKPGEN